MKFISPLLAVSCSLGMAATARLPIKDLGGFIKVITASAGPKCQGRLDCLDDAVAAEMKAHGLAIDVRSPIAFAVNVVQVRTFGAVDKLVICNDKALLKEGATIAIVLEDGKPVIYIDKGQKKSFEEAGILFSDTLMKIARVI